MPCRNKWLTCEESSTTFHGFRRLALWDPELCAAELARFLLFRLRLTESLEQEIENLRPAKSAQIAGASAEASGSAAEGIGKKTRQDQAPAGASAEASTGSCRSR